MSHYTYTDHDGDKITIISPDGPYVSFEIASEDAFGAVSAKAGDAPAIALAILEAAGFKEAQDENYPTFNTEGIAMHYLRDGIQRRAVQAERKAEDAKVLEYLLATGQADNEGYRVLDLDRENYRAARKFFKEAQ